MKNSKKNKGKRLFKFFCQGIDRLDDPLLAAPPRPLLLPFLGGGGGADLGGGAGDDAEEKVDNGQDAEGVDHGHQQVGRGQGGEV